MPSALWDELERFDAQWLDSMRASVFSTCLVDSLYPHVGEALVQLLGRLGVEVDVPKGQTCCGQMHINTGYGAMATELIRHQVKTFEKSEVVVAPSASCVGSIRHQYEKIARESGDQQLVDAVKELAARTYEVSEFLVDVLGVSDVGAYFPHRVTYHPTCHSLRALRVGERPDDCSKPSRQSNWSSCPTPRCAAALVGRSP